MSAMEELEEGEITDSDSVVDDEQGCKQPAGKAFQQYSLFSDQPRHTAALTPVSCLLPHRQPKSSSSSSDSDSEDGMDKLKKKMKTNNVTLCQSTPFVNPNFVTSGSRMPPVPKQSKKNIWGSVLQEQILTAEVGSVSMGNKMVTDRNVESYDFTQAEKDDRPFLVEDEINAVEDDLFGGVIDLEKSVSKQHGTLKRKHKGSGSGKRHAVEERLDKLPQVTENSSIEDVTYYISTVLKETKVHLMRRVVKGVGQAKALKLLKKTLEVEAAGGMLVMNKSRRRTKGGVYLTLLKSFEEVSKEQLDEIFEEETQQALELRKLKKARARKRRQERDEQKRASNLTAENKSGGQLSSEMNEAHESCPSRECEMDTPQNVTDHLWDNVNSRDSAQHSDSNSSVSGGEDSNLKPQQELRQKIKDPKTLDVAKDADAITVDDILEIEVDEEEFID